MFFAALLIPSPIAAGDAEVEYIEKLHVQGQVAILTEDIDTLAEIQSELYDTVLDEVTPTDCRYYADGVLADLEIKWDEVVFPDTYSFQFFQEQLDGFLPIAQTNCLLSIGG